MTKAQYIRKVKDIRDQVNRDIETLDDKGNQGTDHYEYLNDLWASLDLLIDDMKRGWE